MKATRARVSPPSRLFLHAFARYARGYLGKSFHSIRMLRSGPAPVVGEAPLVVYCNHPAWWDPLVGLHLAMTCWPERTHYAPIDSEQLERYGFFSKLGFFGVERGTRAGARRFLETAAAILGAPGSALWITPQGRFGDPRERPPRLEPGIGHLARRGDGLFVPLALEYPFWEEKLPEALVAFGEPIDAVELSGWRGGDATAALAERLGETQDRLAAAAVARDPAAFSVLLAGRSGMGGVYERFKRLVSRLGGKRFRRAHGSAEEADRGEPRDPGR